MKFKCLIAVPLFVLSVSALAEDSGFLSDYSKLTAAGQATAADRIYIQDGLFDRAGQFQGIFVDQPEIFIASDSKYKGISPDDMKAIADAMRASIMQALQGDFLVLAAPKEGGLTLRVALTNVHLQKKKRGLLSYTPVGFVVHGVSAALEGVMTKVNLTGADIELELEASTTSEALAMAIIAGNRDSDHQMTWQEAESYMTLIGQRVACRLNNAKASPDARTDCMQIQLSVPESK